MTKFSEFIKEENKNNMQSKVSEIQYDIDELIDKYSTYSTDELMKEFLKETEKQKERGELNAEKLDNIKNVLFPHLTEEQKDRLNQLLSMVRQWLVR